MNETRNKGSEITTHDIKLMTGEFDLESIHHLDLNKRGIQDLSVIGKCTGLVHLNASHNCIRYLRPLGDLKLLENLDLSCNNISSLDGLEGLDSLVHLNLAGNMIRSTDELNCLSKLEKLRKLRLKDNIHNYSNPVCQTTSQYKKVISEVLPQLTTIDGERIKGKGSDFYDACDELDSVLKDYTGSCGEPPAYKSAPWPSGAFLEAEKPLNRCVEEAELGFNDVMSLCRNMNYEALKSVTDADCARWSK